MAKVQAEIDVDVPASRAYEQWRRFEDYPRFLTGVEEVRPVDERTLHWRARFLGRTQEWDAEITTDEPPSRLAWRTREGPSDVSVAIAPLGPSRSHVIVTDDIHERGLAARLAVALGYAERRLQNELAQFRAFVE